ncbi:MAG: acylase [Bacteroidota bacterium]
MKYLSLLLVLCVFACKSTPTVSPPADLARWEAQAENITIIRDDYGVPHIYGETDADAVFGLLYAQCEDDFPRVERNYVWATGRLAEIEGEEALYSDLRARLFMTVEEAKAAYENSPEWLKKLCDAFADGINYYLYTHPEVTPQLLTRFEPWMPMYFSEGSIGGDIERVSTQKIRAMYEEKGSFGITEPEPEEHWAMRENEPSGSNGFAISGTLTESGDAMLLINPHTSFYFRGEVHVVSEEGLNAYGAVTWGQFFVYQGFNEKTGWMHTSTYTDVIDEFVEEITEKEGTYTYAYGEEVREVEEKTVTLNYKEGGDLKFKTFPMYRTHHGPVTHKEGDKWVSTALMWEPVKALSQSYTRTKLNNHEEFREMMDIRTNSSNNTVFADGEGNIAYYHGNYIPIRDIQFDYSQPVDGSNPQTDWQGLHPVDEAIVVVNPPNGWIQNCNSTPFTSAGPYSPKVEDYPRYMSLNRENYRGIHAIHLLEELEKNKGLTLEGLIEMAYDPVLPAFEVLIPGLIEAYEQDDDKNPKLLDPINTLRAWDFKVSAASVPMSLAHYYGTLYYQKGNIPEGFSRRAYMNLLNYFGTKSPMGERLAIFEEVLQQLESDFGTWETPWGEINRFQRISGEIGAPFDDSQASLPVGLASGRWGALAAYGARRGAETKRIYGYRGNSFVAVVEFGDKLKAKSLLAGGQSNDPNSPHFFDQAQPYIDVAFKDVAFYRDEVEKRAEKTYKPGQR